MLPRAGRTTLTIGALLLAVLVSGCGGGGGSDSTGGEGGYKQSLFQRLEAELNEKGSPKVLTDCMMGYISSSVGKAEVEAAFGKIPLDASAEEMAKAIGPKAFRAFALAPTICVHKLLAEGKLSAKEVAQALNRPSG